MSDLVIVGVPISNYVRAVRMVCEEKGVPYNLEPAFPHSPDVDTIHPAGLVPCLRHGDLTLFESSAIANYIDDAFDGPSVFPGDTKDIATIRQWVSFTNSKIDPCVMREFVVPLAFPDEEKGPDMDRINRAIPKIEKSLETISAVIAKTGFLAGDKFSFADCNLVPMLAALTMFPQGQEILQKYPVVLAYLEKHTARESFQKTAPPAD